MGLWNVNVKACPYQAKENVQAKIVCNFCRWFFWSLPIVLRSFLFSSSLLLHVNRPLEMSNFCTTAKFYMEFPTTTHLSAVNLINSFISFTDNCVSPVCLCYWGGGCHDLYRGLIGLAVLFPKGRILSTVHVSPHNRCVEYHVSYGVFTVA